MVGHEGSPRRGYPIGLGMIGKNWPHGKWGEMWQNQRRCLKVCIEFSKFLSSCWQLTTTPHTKEKFFCIFFREVVYLGCPSRVYQNKNKRSDLKNRDYIIACILNVKTNFLVQFFPPVPGYHLANWILGCPFLQILK